MTRCHLVVIAVALLVAAPASARQHDEQPHAAAAKPVAGNATPAQPAAAAKPAPATEKPEPAAAAAKPTRQPAAGGPTSAAAALARIAKRLDEELGPRKPNPQEPAAPTARRRPPPDPAPPRRLRLAWRLSLVWPDELTERER